MASNSVQTAVQPADFRLGFDGGGTKTRAVVLDSRQQILGEGDAASSNPYAVGMEAALDAIEIAADLALAQANLSRRDIAGWGLGLGGVCSSAESAQVEAQLRIRVGPNPKIVAVEDVVAAWSGAFGAKNDETSHEMIRETALVPRVVCIAGTGANCWGKNSRGEIASADGLGPLLGDRGSGYWIGEQALRHTARCADGVLEIDDLSEAVLQHFAACDTKELIRIVYAPNFERSSVAELVRVVLFHAENEAARAILSRAGEELADTSLAVLRRLNADALGWQYQICGDVALIGGVLAHAEPVKAAFLARFQQTAPQTQLVDALYEPAIGAALLL